MNENIHKTNYDIAKEEADIVDNQIIDVLKQGYSFRVEAGAGSGKTYSLNRVIEWIQANKMNEFNKKKQNVVCITYTNAAVDVIAERLQDNSFIIPSTIHSFAWNAIKQYQSTLIRFIEEDEKFQADKGDFYKVTEVKYTLGHRYKENGIQYLYHDDVLKMFCMLLDNMKFRRVFADRFPLILIDEYQDSYKPIIDRFVDYFISKDAKPQFGFFGDAWQTIYQSNNACGLIEHEKLKVIKKGSNFRSAPNIVKFLNDIRPDLPQKSAIDNFEGEVVVVTCDDYNGIRRTDRYFKDELPANELKIRLDKLNSCIRNNVPSEESLKTLMITHKVLAAQQGYEKLLTIINDGLRDKQDPFLLFFMNIVEPVYEALKTTNTQLLFDTLSIKRYPITRKSEKAKWKEFELILKDTRKQNAVDVINAIVDAKLIPIPPNIEGYIDLYYNAPDTLYGSNSTIQEFLNLKYEEFLGAIKFLYPESEFSTEHGVKGEEYDNVIFVIGKGWNQYQFEIYAPMINKPELITSDKESSFIKNRNLFYVCCSRPKKRLIIFVTIPTDSTFKKFVLELVGKEKIYTYTQFIDKYNHKLKK